MEASEISQSVYVKNIYLPVSLSVLNILLLAKIQHSASYLAEEMEVLSRKLVLK